jgi:ubiquinone/menaquinone biosynthesis C-methylase UbiE
LQQQAQQLAHESSWLLDQIGVAQGASVVEIGCGPHGCLDLLAERVGPSGRVVGVERSSEAVALARRLIAQRNLANVDVVEADARATGLPKASFDLATSRLVLVNVPRPEQIVAEAAALVRPGGWVAFHEADYISHVCDPPSAACPPGHGRRNLLLDFSENLSDRLIAQNLVGAGELAGLKADLSRHLADAGTLVVSHLYFQVWGRRPSV